MKYGVKKLVNTNKKSKHMKLKFLKKHHLTKRSGKSGFSNTKKIFSKTVHPTKENLKK
jgi:hypothetical protein